MDASIGMMKMMRAGFGFTQYIRLGLECQDALVARSSAQVLRSAHVKERG